MFRWYKRTGLQSRRAVTTMGEVRRRSVLRRLTIRQWPVVKATL